MASRKMVWDLFLSKQSLIRHLTSQQPQGARLQSILENECSGNRRYSVFNEFSKQVKGQVDSNPEFQKSVKDLKEKAEKLKGVKEELKVRTKQTTEQLYKHVDGVWTEAEATAKKVSANVKEKISAAKEEVKEKFGKQDTSDTSDNSANHSANVKDEKQQQSQSHDNTYTLYGKFKSSVSSAAPKVSMIFQKVKEAKVVDLAKKGYDIVKDELSGEPVRRKHLDPAPPPAFTGETSSKTDIVIVPSKQSRWSKKWEEFKGKMQGHPVFKRINVVSEPVVTKGQEIAEDMRERWETSDSPIVHKIQDLNESIFQETNAAESLKEIRRRDPSFSLPEFVTEVQEVIKPILNAYMKGDTETLKKYCSREVIERCKAEQTGRKSLGLFHDNKILHISEIVVGETKMMGTTPIIILTFQTQQVHCVRDKDGSITEGGKDTIHTIYYAWAMQQVDPEEIGEGAVYPIWKLREMQQLGVQSLI